MNRVRTNPEASASTTRWLEQLAISLALPDVAGFLQTQTLRVRGVECRFLAQPSNADALSILLDAGPLHWPRDADLLACVSARNFDNFLMGAPQFLRNPQSQRLVIAQNLVCTRTRPQAFAPILESLALQALAWQHKERP